MGVTGLWRLIEPTGKPVPVETLENKVLAVDISIWLHQVVKGYQDARGAPMPNAHLMGLFQRLCKLLYFRIKPVFVFDGAFPELKKETIAKRQDSKSKYNFESERLKREIMILLGKKTAIGSLLGKQISPKKPVHNAGLDEDIFKLPEIPQKPEETESESEDEDTSTSSSSTIDLHTVDLESDNFKNLPVKEKYDLLLDLKETRKMNSWGRLHELPKKSDNFSDFQMQRLLKRRKVQECLQETEKEMGDTCLSLQELESLMNEEGIITKIDCLPTRRIASSDTTRFLLIKDMKEAVAEASKNKQKTDLINQPSCSKDVEKVVENKVDDLDEDLQKAIEMSMECVDNNNDETQPNTSYSSKTSRSDSFDLSDATFMLDSEYSDSDEEVTAPDISSAKAYIMQYSDFTHKAIENIVCCAKKKVKQNKGINVNDVLEELYSEKSIIVDNVELLSDEEENENITVKELKSSKLVKLNDSPIVIDSNTSQSSLDLVENQKPDYILLDSSMEETTDVLTNKINNTNENIKPINIESSDSSDEEFEEVVNDDNSFVKPVVQINLNIGTAPDDDIFADVFAKIQDDTKVSKVINKDEINKGMNKLSLPTNNIISRPIVKSAEQINVQTNTTIEPKVLENNKVNNIDFHKDKQKLTNELNTVSEDIEKEKLLQEIATNKIIEPKTVQNEPKLTTSKLNVQQDIKVKENNLLQDKATNKTIEQEKDTNEAMEPQTVQNKPKLTTDELNTIVEQMEVQESNLVHEKARIDRMGRNITAEMTRDVQELLKIFGIPYIVAPMEAEAQCAFLESIKLTDGTITDDSDIWLFGGKTVYKNFFNQKKHVLQFLADRIEKSFKLNREQLVLLALLVGSDYTTGVSGVGPVTAMEILASFPLNKRDITEDIPTNIRYTKLVNGLQEFKKWIKTGKRTDNTVLKKKLRNVDVADDFPSTRVVQAYFEPNVEKSEETFTWGELNVTVLRDYAKTKFGWSQNKFDEIINPVLKRLLERKSQKSMKDYFKRKIDLAVDEHMSKRVKAAIEKMGPDGNVAENENTAKTKPKRKRKAAKNEDKEINNKETNKVIVKTITENVVDSKFDIKVPKSNRYQEIIPQREKDRKHVLETKLKAIEVFRKTTIDKKRVKTKKKVVAPKDDAGLSESDSD